VLDLRQAFSERRNVQKNKMAKYTVLNYAADILKGAAKPLTYQEIWKHGEGTEFQKMLSLKGKTPWNTVGSRLFVDVRDNPVSLFETVGKNPARFWLRARHDDLTKADFKALDEIELTKESKPTPDAKPHERKLHPLVAYFAYANQAFNRGRQIYTKTIYHEKSLKKSPSEWVHPDMVGFYLPLDKWHDSLIDFNKITDKAAIRLYSFEVKWHINRSNYREYFFQAVSNSAWANEGYLVATSIEEDDDLLAELERLSVAFGIGIIEFDLNDFDSSSVLFPARPKSVLDWELMNKLCGQNHEFEGFIDNVRKDYDVKKIHPAEHDEILKDPDLYIESILGIHPKKDDTTL
jgi:uncharacterized protein